METTNKLDVERRQRPRNQRNDCSCVFNYIQQIGVQKPVAILSPDRRSASTNDRNNAAPAKKDTEERGSRGWTTRVGQVEATWRLNKQTRLQGNVILDLYISTFKGNSGRNMLQIFGERFLKYNFSTARYEKRGLIQRTKLEYNKWWRCIKEGGKGVV